MQRFARKKENKTNALLTLYLSNFQREAADDAETIYLSDTAQWLLQFTPGELASPEKLRNVTNKPRLQWLGYELVRHTFQGKTRWTWQRPKKEEEDLFDLMNELCRRKQWREVERLLTSAASQPGFHGVREQTWRLGLVAERLGYDGPIPPLYFMRKIKHGERFVA